MSINTNTYNIFCLRKNGELLEQAKIVESPDNYTLELNPLPSAINHMFTYLTELFHLIMKYDKDTMNHCVATTYQTKRFQYMNNEFVEATIFQHALMRKGSYFYVCQKSERGTRFLLYAMNRVHHSSISLGFSMIVPKVDAERTDMKKMLLNHKTLKVEHTLIENDDLFFL